MLVTFALAACGSDSSTSVDNGASTEATSSTDANNATPATTATTDNGCKQVEQPAPKSDTVPKPTTKLDPSKENTIVFKTSCGDFTILLDADKSPKTAASMFSLAKADFYNDTTFHRVVPDFVIQGGDPQGNGSGDAGYRIVEKPPAGFQYKLGSVAMAKGGNEPAGTSSSQFFVVSGAQGATLPPDYAYAGKLSSGEETVARISALGTGDGPPSQPVVIYSAKARSK